MDSSWTSDLLARPTRGPGLPSPHRLGAPETHRQHAACVYTPKERYRAVTDYAVAELALSAIGPLFLISALVALWAHSVPRSVARWPFFLAIFGRVVLVGACALDITIGVMARSALDIGFQGVSTYITIRQVSQLLPLGTSPPPQSSS